MMSMPRGCLRVRKQQPFLLLAVILAAAPAWAQSTERCQVSGVAKGEVYGRAVSVDFRDPFQQSGLELRVNGERFPPGSTLEEDGHYLVELVSAGPLVQPVGCAPVGFEIDRQAPKIELARPDWLPPDALPRVLVTGEDGPVEVEVFIDGEPYDPARPPKPGEHLMEATARDRAGNVASQSQGVTTFGYCQVSSWIEYRRTTSRLSAAFYFPWYVQSPECPASSVWCNCFSNPKPQNPRPARGFYGSDNQSVVNAQLDQMKAYGVDVVAIEWTGMTSEESNILNRVVPALAARNLKFVLLYDTLVRLGVGRSPIDLNAAKNRSLFIGDFQKFASHSSYFKHARYLKFSNLPVVYVFISRALVGSDANIRSVFDALRTAAYANGFSGLYLVADHLFWDPIDLHKLDLINPSAVTSFSPVDPGQGVPQGSASRPIRTWAQKMSGLYTSARGALLNRGGLVDVTPGIFVQWNNVGLDSAQCFGLPRTDGWNLKDGSDWSYMIQTAGLSHTYVAEEHSLTTACNELVFPGDAGGTSIVWTYSYNEWYEGAGVEQLSPRTPSYPYGFGLEPLQILQGALP